MEMTYFRLNATKIRLCTLNNSATLPRADNGATLLLQKVYIHEVHWANLTLTFIMLPHFDFLLKSCSEGHLLGKQNLMKICYVDYPWQRHLHDVYYKGFGGNRCYLFIPGEGCLDIYILRLIKCLCSVSELLSCLTWKTYQKMTIYNY